MATELEKREKERKRLSKAMLKEAAQKTPDLGKMRELLEAGAYPDYQGHFDNITAITHFVRARNIPGIRMMLEFKASPEEGSEFSAFGLAINNKDLEIVNILIEAGANVSRFRLSLALKTGDVPVVRRLLDAGVRDLEDLEYGTSINIVLNEAEKTGNPVLADMVRDSLKKKEADAAAQKAAAPPPDPRDLRMAEMAQQIRDLAASLTEVRRELEELKNPPCPLDKKKLPTPGNGT